MGYASANFHATVIFFCENCMYIKAEDCRRLAYTGVRHDVAAGLLCVDYFIAQQNHCLALWKQERQTRQEVHG